MMLSIPSNELACQALFLHAADEGRGAALFGENWKETLNRVLPFVECVPFPSLYLEFPLAGDPFLDVTALYGEVASGTRFRSEAAAGTERMIDWFAQVSAQSNSLSFGFELDAGNDAFAPAAVHFQHYSHIRLAQEFCDALGEPAAGQLYMEQTACMPEGWTPAFFGMFRGRPGSPLRVCGYLNRDEQRRSAEDPSRLEEVFRQVGFRAYDDRMLRQIRTLLAMTPVGADFQFDVYPDRRIGDTFAIDFCLGLKQSGLQKASFVNGTCADVMKQLETWGAADDRWHLAAGTCLTRALPVTDEDGRKKVYAMTVCPKWVKARWRSGVLQKAKLYCEGKAGIIRNEEGEKQDGPQHAL